VPIFAPVRAAARHRLLERGRLLRRPVPLTARLRRPGIDFVIGFGRNSRAKLSQGVKFGFSYLLDAIQYFLFRIAI
jgi:hypothetical protein